MPTQSRKLTYLLHTLWQSPLFGDSFPQKDEDLFFAQLERMYPIFAERITPILQQGMPEAHQSKIQATIDQLAPKTITFCASIATGEVEDEAGVINAALIMGLVYWIDQSMDRGDEATLSAVHLLTDLNAKHNFQSDIVRARFEALRQFDSLIRQVAKNPHDLPHVLRALETDVLITEAELRNLSRELLLESSLENFWQTHHQHIAQKMIDCSGLMTVTSLLYAVKHNAHPELPSLGDVYRQPELVHLIHKVFNAAVRVFDDAGDWQVDAGHENGWGVFNINLFNQTNEQLAESFLTASGLKKNPSLFQQAQAALTLPAPKSRQLLIPIYINWVRQQTAALPDEIQQEYASFLTLTTRVMEAGLVNMLGDIFLSEGTGVETLDKELLNWIAPLSDIPQWIQEAV